MKTEIQNQCFEFICAAKQYGFSYEAIGSTIKLTKTFAANDTSAYCAAEDNAYKVLSLAPQRTDGSIWGSDSGSIGGMMALRSGNFRMNKSGVSTRFTKVLNKFTNV